jgi:pimeloyl-ACP methyl ester carboxylesterase
MPVLITRGTSIDYDVHGKGPPLLLIGGLGFGRWCWFKQVPALSSHFHIITFDIRSTQNLANSVDELSAKAATLIDHLGIKKTHILGTSLGGFVAQKLALERPDLVDRLVLVCTSYGSQSPQPLSPRVLGRMFGWGSLSPESAVRRGLETAASAAYRSQHSEEFEQIVRWRLADSPSLTNFYQQALAGARFDASREVRNIVSPTLVIHGAEDYYVPVANAVALAKAIPGAKLRVLEDAAHLVFIEQAKEVNKEVVSFLKPSKSRRRTKKPQQLPAAQEPVFLFELRKRWRAKKLLTKQKTKQLIEWIEEVNGAIASFFKPQKPKSRPTSRRSSARPKTKKPRKTYRTSKTRPSRNPRKAKGSFAYRKKIEGWFHAGQEATVTWEKKLRSWLFS